MAKTKSSLAYTGVRAPTPPQLESHNRAPTVNDRLNFSIGTIWIDTSCLPAAAPTDGDIYMLVSLQSHVATWITLGGGDIGTITGDTGGPISDDALDNINLLSGITGLSVDGNPATWTLTLNSSGGGNLFQTLTGDDTNIIFPDAAGNIDITGGNNITTSGAGTAITASLTGTTQYAVQVGNAAGSLSSVVPSATVGEPLISQGAAADPTFGTALVVGGGTGSTTFTPYAVITAGTVATNPFQNVVGVGAAGEILTSNGAGALPTWQSQRTGFKAYLTANQANITGDGTVYKIPFDTTAGPGGFDLGGNFDTTTGEFVVPFDGYYLLQIRVFFRIISAGFNNAQTWISRNTPVTAQYSANNINPQPIIDNTVGTAEWDCGQSEIVYLTAGERVYVKGMVGNNTKTVGITGLFVTDVRTNFSGFLLTQA